MPFSRTVLTVLGLILSLFLCEIGLAQDSDLYRIETRDGNVFIGTLISEDETRVVIEAQGIGELTIERANIRRMEAIDPERIRDGVYWYPNPQATRYLFAPNAIGLPQGAGYYQNTWIFFNNVNYGFTDNVSMGVGTVPVFLFGVPAVPVWLLPKVSISSPADNVHLAAGAVLGGIVGADDSGGAGIVYGLGTFGNQDSNISVGAGFGYAGTDFSSTPALTISAMHRVSRTLYLITENYAFTNDGAAGVASVGLRWAPERFAVDFGLVRPLDVGGDFIGFPWLGVAIPFGR